MADNHTPEQRHINMSHIRSFNTKPELALRSALWHFGFRYRVNDKRLPGKPDIVLAKYKTVIFVNGCFWHGHKGCGYYTIPKTNTNYWVAKINRNRERDQEIWRQLEAKGWAVIVVWECQLNKCTFDNTFSKIKSEIQINGERFQQDCANRRASRLIYLQECREKKTREKALLTEINRV